MIHYDKENEFYELIGEGFNLFAYTLPDLIKQAWDIHKINLLETLN